MPKTFFYKLFKVGSMPDEFKNNLEYFEEGIKTTIVYRNYRAPGKYFGVKKVWQTGTFGYSKGKIIGIIGKTPFIDVPFSNELYKKLIIRKTEQYVSVQFDAHDFNREASGEIEVKFYVDAPDKFQQLLHG